MPTILAIETSTELASAAILRGGQLTAHESSGVQNHSQTILPMVQRLLREAGLTLADCDAIAFGAGPGSFTGVRTACGLAQGLSFGSGLPLIPVVTLQAMAQACHVAAGATEVLAVLDARMGEVYWAQYRFTDDGWQTVIEPALAAPDAVAPHGPVRACGNGLTAYPAVFGGKDFMCDSLPAVMPHAGQLAVLAQAAFQQGRTVAAGDAQPIYLRNKVAFTTSERLAKAAA